MGSNLNFKNNNFGKEPPPGDGGGGGGMMNRHALTRQGSIYSLTFDEFQNSLGKDFGSMNMDELLKNIWSAEETQAMALASTSGGIIPVTGGGQEGLQLQRQGSLTLPRTLSQKTVDQVWKDLSNNGVTNLSQAQAQAQSESQRQQTLGEVTLEEFLVRAGVVREEPQIEGNARGDSEKGGYFGNDANAGFSVEFQQAPPRVVSGLMGNIGAESANHLQVQGSSLPLNVNGARSTYQQQQQQPIMPKQPGFGYGTQISQLNSPGIRGGLMGLGDQSLTNNRGLVQGAAVIPGALGVGAVSPVTPLSSDGIGKSNGDSSSLSPSPYMFNGGVRGRKSGGTVEKVVERRQRRMIKNRESAARSRARKQAYTVELEAEVAKLKEENDELQRKQAKIMEMQKNQEMELRNVEGGPKKRLRRTESGPW